MQNKMGGNQHKIPYTMAVTYEHPPVDNVASEHFVDVPEESDVAIKEIETVEQAIELYLRAFSWKFHSREGRRQRKRSLQLFHQYLAIVGHSLKLRDLTLSDGQYFINTLANHYNGSPLSFDQKKKYRSALRSFSRFLHELELADENIFLAVTMK